MSANPVKAKMGRGEVALGTMVLEFDTTGIGAIAAAAGAEWVVFDQEHTGWSMDRIRVLVAGARAAGVVPVVRPPAAVRHLISGLLDLGALGVLAPMIETPEQAEALVAACRYPPRGRRGAAFGIAHDAYVPGGAAEKMAAADRDVLVIAMVETPGGVEHADAIAAVDGVDALWIGHFDLTSFLGIPGEFGHPRFLAAVERVIAAGTRHGKPVGILVASPEDAREKLALGFRALLYSGDIWLYQEALRSGLDAVRNLLGEEG